MGPDFEIGGGTDVGGGVRQKPRPSVLVRLLEMTGLVLVAYGLGTNRFLLAALGGALIVVSYAVYRRRHGQPEPTGSDGPSHGSTLDGGGD